MSWFRAAFCDGTVRAAQLWFHLRLRRHTDSADAPRIIAFRGRRVGHYRADLVIEDCLLLECKATPALSRSDGRQIINILKACPLELGLLLHFGPSPRVFRFISTNKPLSAD